MTPPSKPKNKAKRKPAVVEPTTQSQPQSVAGQAAARRVLVIGLDGATYDILDPMRAEGRMPNLDRLITEGTAGILESTKPPITPAAWTTFMTGKGPGRHGIIDFERYDPRTNTLSFNSTYEIREPTIWNILSAKGLRVGSINLPMTFPPKPVNGFLISGFETPSTDAEFTYPPELSADSRWMWDILQRSNFVKNLCLLGVCFHLLHHRTGCFSVDAWLRGEFPGCRRD